MKPLLLLASLICLISCKTYSSRFTTLFPEDGIPQGWMVRHWADIKNAPPEGAAWKVENGILYGSTPRGTWLVSDREFADFILEFEFKLPPQGNGGCGLRFPLQGDPAFDGLELQMVDPRYYPPQQTVLPDELTGALYKAVAPKDPPFRKEEWNHYRIYCKGSLIRVHLNGQEILNVYLEEQTKEVLRHDGRPASPLGLRPRRGHIGFQELSRGGGHVQIRNARLKEL